MKMRVRGYDEHRLKDPYKFWAKLLNGAPPGKRKCIATYTYVTRIDDSTLEFYMRYTPDGQQLKLCTLAANDTWTITVPKEEVLPSHGNRLVMLTNAWAARNKKNFSLYENPCRLYEGSWHKCLPYEPGVQVYKGKAVNPEKYVDRKRVLDEQDAAPIRKKLKKIYELAPIMIRLLEAHNADRRPTQYWKRRQLLIQLMAEFDPDNINGLDAERVYLIGEAVTSRPYTWQRTAWQKVAKVYLESDEEYRKRCVVNGLRKLREHVYSKEGVYKYEPVKT